MEQKQNRTRYVDSDERSNNVTNPNTQIALNRDASLCHEAVGERHAPGAASANRELADLKARVDAAAFARDRYKIVLDDSGRGRCPCPGNHNNGDSDPSLRLDKDRFTCWSQRCLERDDVFGLVMKLEGVDFSAAKQVVAEYAGVRFNGNGSIRRAKPAEPGGRHQVVASYEYRNSAGEVAYTICRWEGGGKPKSFKAQPNGVAKEERVLYKLPELEASKGVVVIVEGEKKVDLLHSLDFVATTCAFGSNGWSPHYAECLRGRDVIMWPDKDTPGEKFEAAVLRSLEGVAKSLRHVQPPDSLPEGGDVMDVFEADGGGAVRRLIEGAEPWMPLAPTDIESRRIVCMADVEAEDTEWLWFPRIPRGHLTLLFGDGGVGKSHVCLAVAAALSKGAALPGCDGTGKPSRTVYFTGEDHLGELKRRLDSMQADPRQIVACGEPFALDEEGLAFVESTIVTYQAEFVVIDPVVAFLGRDLDFYKANETRAILAPLSAAANRTGAAILLSTHVTKGQTAKAAHRAIGSGDFVNAARSALLAGSDPDDSNQCALFQEKTNLGPKAEPVGYSIRDGQFRWEKEGVTSLTPAQVLGGGDSVDAGAGKEAEALIRDMCADECKATDVINQAESEGINKRTLQRVAGKLCDHRRDGFGPGSVVYWQIKSRSADAA
jgi:hypothetical protein